MMNVQHFSPPPRWLPLHLLLGGATAGVLMMIAQGVSFDKLPEMPVPGLWTRCGASLIVLTTALLLAGCTGLAVALLTRQINPVAEKMAALLGRALACLPIAALAWGFVGIWIGRDGHLIETLLPAQLPEAQITWQASVARLLWEYLAPILVLAVPLTGEVIHAAISDAHRTVDLDFSLRARGVPGTLRLWHHHLRQLLPLLRVRMQALCLIAPVYLILVEDVLRFMGWGGWMAQIIRAGDVRSLALGFISGGVMMALLCATLNALPGRWKDTHNLMPVISWQPWLLWALGIMSVLSLTHTVWIVLWLALLIASGAGWHRAWNEVAETLPLDASRALGATDFEIWRKHIAPAQGRMLVAWISGVFAQTLLGIALACAVRPALLQELGGPLADKCRPLAIATTQDAAQTLADPSAVIDTGGLIALAALCLIQVSRIVQPRSL